MTLECSMGELFNGIPTQLLSEAFSHAAIKVQILSVHKHSPVSIARCSFIQLSELQQCRVNKLANV